MGSYNQCTIVHSFVNERPRAAAVSTATSCIPLYPTELQHPAPLSPLSPNILLSTPSTLLHSAAALALALQRQVQFEQLQQQLLNEQIRLQRLRNMQVITIKGRFVDEFMDLPLLRTRTQPTQTITEGRQCSNSGSDSEPGTDASITTVGSVVIVNVVPDRSGTIVAWPAWDELTLPSPMRNITQRHTHVAPNNTQLQQASLASEYRCDTPSPSTSTDTSCTEMETEDEPKLDADGDNLANRTTTPCCSDGHLYINAVLNAGQRPQLDLPVYPHSHVLSSGSTPASASASPYCAHNANHQPRFGPLRDQAAALAGVGDCDAHIIISDAAGSTGIVGESLNMALGVGVGIDGMESLQANDDFAMGVMGAMGAMGATVVIVLDTHIWRLNTLNAMILAGKYILYDTGFTLSCTVGSMDELRYVAN
ncbi:hypothetical protein F5887DRAFT_1084537 [Amanita rubescens]|nr:hypothetical protein F5887DRAFT_1084537 [Amanita rubescens]